MLKGPDLTTFAPAVRAVAHGQLYISPIIAEGIRQRWGCNVAHALRYALNEEELELLRLLAQGHSSKQIGEALCVSAKAIEKRLDKLFDYLRVQTRTEAAVKAVATGLVLDWQKDTQQ